MGKKVLGLDLAKTDLPDALAAMVNAWYEAQDVDVNPPTAAEDRKPIGQFIAKTYLPSDDNLVSQAEFAKLAGVSRSAVSQAISKGSITEIVEQNGKILIKKSTALQQYQHGSRLQKHQKITSPIYQHSLARKLNSTKGAELIEAKTGRSCSRQNLDKICRKGALQGSPCVLRISPLRLDADLLVTEYLSKVAQYQIGVEQPASRVRESLP